MTASVMLESAQLERSIFDFPFPPPPSPEGEVMLVSATLRRVERSMVVLAVRSVKVQFERTLRVMVGWAVHVLGWTVWSVMVDLVAFGVVMARMRWGDFRRNGDRESAAVRLGI